jgi:hypothetical protein
MKVYRLLACVGALALITTGAAKRAEAQSMSFFITSVGSGDGAKLGGLEGADAHCRHLAEAAGVTGKTWRAYLSQVAADGKPAVNARDRIGKGPWFNAKGVRVAANLDELHSADTTGPNKRNSLTEKGGVVNGRGDTPNTHDILTGSTLNGRVSSDTTDTTCRNWTSNSTGSALLGHHDRQGGGTNPTSWNSAHPSRGCSQQNLQATGGAGLFYCFAI